MEKDKHIGLRVDSDTHKKLNVNFHNKVQLK